MDVRTTDGKIGKVCFDYVYAEGGQCLECSASSGLIKRVVHACKSSTRDDDDGAGNRT